MVSEKILLKHGYIEFIDKNGLTPKSQKAKDKIKLLEHNFQDLLNPLSIKIVTNPATIVSKSQFSNLKNIIKRTWENAKSIGYPFVEELFMRTSFFNSSTAFSMPLKQIPYSTPQKMAKIIYKQIQKFGYPDQIILHPRLSLTNLKKCMIAARFKLKASTLEAEIGHKGIRDINQLHKGKIHLSATLDSEFELKIEKGVPTDKEIEQYKKIILAGKIFLPFAEEMIIDETAKHKEIVYEFRVQPYNEWLYMIFNDIEYT
ncbi:hypothetical protein GF362_07190 [Candidatus Dojkabacteria bacterium]|nr:hypothetical protein [Candidatus Dojkabacteria bacterium]